MPKLIINNPDGTAVKYGLNGRNFTVGRAENNDIVLPGGTSSNHHAVLKQSDSGDFIITDLDSTNHTRVNDRIIQTALLHDGAVLQFGDIVGTYESEFEPVDDVATQIYEAPQPIAAPQAPVYQEPVRPTAQPQAVRRAAPTIHRPAPAASASTSGEGGCFALILVLLLAAFAFGGGVWLRHSKEHDGQSATDWVKSIMAERQIAQAEAAK